MTVHIQLLSQADLKQHTAASFAKNPQFLRQNEFL